MTTPEGRQLFACMLDLETQHFDKVMLFIPGEQVDSQWEMNYRTVCFVTDRFGPLLGTVMGWLHDEEVIAEAGALEKDFSVCFDLYGTEFEGLPVDCTFCFKEMSPADGKKVLHFVYLHFARGKDGEIDTAHPNPQLAYHREGD